MNRLQKLIQLNQKATQLIQFDRYDDENDSGIVAPAVKTGVAAGVGAAGLYGAGALGTLRGAGGVSNAGLNLTQTGAKLGQNLSSIGRGGLSDIASTIGRGAQVTGQAAKKGGSALMALLQKAKGLTAMSSLQDRLVELNTKLDGLVKMEA